MARVIGEFEISTNTRQNNELRHHEQRRHVHMGFARDVTALNDTMEELGNTFTENSSDLLVLDNRNIVDAAVADTVRQLKTLGNAQYQTYIEE